MNETVETLTKRLNEMHRRAQRAEATLERVAQQATWEGFLLGREPPQQHPQLIRNVDRAVARLVAGARADAEAVGFAQGHAEGLVDGAEPLQRTLLELAADFKELYVAAVTNWRKERASGGDGEQHKGTVKAFADVLFWCEGHGVLAVHDPEFDRP